MRKYIISYCLAYTPINSVWARIFPDITSSNLSLEKPEVTSNVSESAYTLKIYLWVPLGGHGAHRANSPREFWPKTAVAKSFWEISWVTHSTGIFTNKRWFQTPAGASGSSTMRARVLASSGIPSTVNVGKRPSPSQVYWEGISPLSAKSVMIFIDRVEEGKSALSMSFPPEHVTSWGFSPKEKNPEPSELGVPCFTNVSPSHIRLSSGENTLSPTRTRTQTIITISRRRFLISNNK